MLPIDIKQPVVFYYAFTIRILDYEASSTLVSTYKCSDSRPGNMLFFWPNLPFGGRSPRQPRNVVLDAK